MANGSGKYNMLSAQTLNYNNIFSAKSKAKASSSKVIEAVLKMIDECSCEPEICEQALNTLIAILTDNGKQITKLDRH